MTMDELKPGQSAYIYFVGGSGVLRHHLLDMGLTPGTEVTVRNVHSGAINNRVCYDILHHRKPYLSSIDKYLI